MSETSSVERESVLSEHEPSESESLVSETGTADSEGASRRTDVFSDIEVEHDATVGGTLRAHKLITDMAESPEKGGHGFYSSGAAYDYNATHIGIDSSTQSEDGIVGLTLRNADDKVLGIVSKLYTGLSSKDKESVSSGLSELRAWVETELARLSLQYLSKTSADTASDVISFLKGILLGDGTYGISEKGIAKLAGIVADYLKSVDFKSGYVDGKGFGLYKDSNGRSVLQVEQLLVTLKAVFASLEIRKLDYVGGDMAFTNAGSEIQRVVSLDSGGNSITDGSTPTAYKCYYLDDDGTTRTENWWKVGDQARCQTFNIESGVYDGVGNKYYWRLVVDTGEEDVVTGTDSEGNVVTKHMGYVTLSNVATGFTLKDPQDASKNLQYSDGTDITFIGMQTLSGGLSAPSSGDKIVQLGSQLDPDGRGTAMMLYVTDCRFTLYYGINDFDLSSHAVAQLSPKESFVYTKFFEMRSGDPTSWTPMVNFRGVYDSTLTYDYYDEVTYDGMLWLCMKTGGSTGDEPNPFSEVWSLVNDGGNALHIEFSSSKGSIVYLSNVDLELTAHLMFGQKDYTEYLFKDSRNQLAWSRDSGVESEDKSWSPTMGDTANILVITHHKGDASNRKDLGSKWEETLSCSFTFSADIYYGGTTSSAKKNVHGTLPLDFII